MKSKILIAIVMAAILIGSAVMLSTYYEDETTPSEEKGPSENGSDPVLGNITSFDDAVNGFSFDLFKEFMADPAITDNIFYSPYSVFTALAMTFEGAKGNTAAEMAEVLGIEQDNESFHNYMKNLYDYLNKNVDYNISTANALWVNQGLELLEEYISIVQDFYGGESSNVDFSNPVEAAEIINTWVTMKLIDTEDKFNYTETEDLKILELPYTGDEMSMIVILPKENTDLSTIVESIDKNTYYEWLNDMTKKEVNIYLPKFEIKTPLYDLNNYLIDLGMQEAFAAADFSGITDQADLFISKVLHKAFIEVNEEGTEAAAATAVIMFETGIPDDDEPSRLEFNCDHPFLFLIQHPFLFLIQHKETKTVLFMGSIEDPTS